LIDQVDAARGDVPRARWIERAIEVRLGEQARSTGKPSPVASAGPSSSKVDWRRFS
jgi:hypothetical protein